MLVQGVEKAIGEAPEEEEDGDKADWVERLLESQLGCLRPFLIRGAQRAALPEFFGEHLDSSRALNPSRNRYGHSRVNNGSSCCRCRLAHRELGTQTSIWEEGIPRGDRANED